MDRVRLSELWAVTDTASYLCTRVRPPPTGPSTAHRPPPTAGTSTIPRIRRTGRPRCIGSALLCSALLYPTQPHPSPRPTPTLPPPPRFQSRTGIRRHGDGSQALQSVRRHLVWIGCGCAFRAGRGARASGVDSISGRFRVLKTLVGASCFAVSCATLSVGWKACNLIKEASQIPTPGQMRNCVPFAVCGHVCAKCKL